MMIELEPLDVLDLRRSLATFIIRDFAHVEPVSYGSSNLVFHAQIRRLMAASARYSSHYSDCRASRTAKDSCEKVAHGKSSPHHPHVRNPPSGIVGSNLPRVYVILGQSRLDTFGARHHRRLDRFGVEILDRVLLTRV